MFRVIIVVRGDNMNMVFCEFCNQRYDNSKRSAGAKFCSRECYENHRSSFKVSIFCKTCGKEKKVKKSKAPKTKYCSKECMPKRIEKLCEWCNGKMMVIPSQIKIGEGKYCSRECYVLGKKKKTRVQFTCHFCKNVFEVHKCRVKRNNVKFCSKKCRIEWTQGENHPKYAREESCCEWCGEKFSDHPSKIKNGRKFCSLSCTAFYGMSTQMGKRSSIELVIEEELEKLGMIYEIQKRIGRYLVDFYLPHLSLVIECDGDYWHSRPGVAEKDKRKDKWLRKNGYSIIRLTETEIRNNPTEALITKIPSLQLALF